MQRVITNSETLMLHPPDRTQALQQSGNESPGAGKWETKAHPIIS